MITVPLMVAIAMSSLHGVQLGEGDLEGNTGSSAVFGASGKPAGNPQTQDLIDCRTFDGAARMIRVTVGPLPDPLAANWLKAIATLDFGAGGVATKLQFDVEPNGASIIVPATFVRLSVTSFLFPMTQDVQIGAFAIVDDGEAKQAPATLTTIVASTGGSQLTAAAEVPPYSRRLWVIDITTTPVTMSAGVEAWFSNQNFVIQEGIFAAFTNGNGNATPGPIPIPAGTRNVALRGGFNKVYMVIFEIEP